MPNTIDLSKTVFQLCREDPNVIAIMEELGFDQITKPASLNTAGRFMTIPKGAVMKGIDLQRIKDVFMEKGYSIKE